jgi:alkylation response protein AidB-like acyl-CoA dehydrogenase
MDFSLTEQQKSLRTTLIDFARKELNEDVKSRDRAQVFPVNLWQRCAELGIQGFPVDKSYHGSNLDALSCAMALEALGYGCTDGGLVFSLGAHLLACVVPLWKHGSDAQKQQYLPGLCDGSLIGMHAMTEAGAGSDPFAMTTIAEPEGNGWRINGAKTLISNGPIGQVAIIYALTNPQKGFYGGSTAFIIDRETAGFTSGNNFETLGLRTSTLSELKFDNVVVPETAVLGQVGAGSRIFTTAMDWERILLGASLVGTMERLLETSIAHARKRFQFGQSIGKFQAVSHKIADMKVHLEAARLLTYQSAWRLDHQKSASLDAAMTKLFVSESLVKIALDTVQIHGGYGYMTDFEVERALRDAIGSTLYSGSSEIQRNIIARWLGI